MKVRRAVFDRARVGDYVIEVSSLSKGYLVTLVDPSGRDVDSQPAATLAAVRREKQEFRTRVALLTLGANA